MSQVRKVSFVCSSSSSFASFSGGEQAPERAGRATLAAEVTSASASGLSSLSSPIFGFLPSFDLVLSAVAEEASYDGEESSLFEPEPAQGRPAAAY